MLVSEMPTAVHFLGNQSGTPKGQVQLNALMSSSLCPSPVCSGRHLSTRCTILKKQNWMFFCQCQLNPPYLLSSFGCVFKIRAPFLTQFSLANSVSPPSSLPPPLCTYSYCHCQLCLPSASRILQRCNHRTF